MLIKSVLDQWVLTWGSWIPRGSVKGFAEVPGTSKWIGLNLKNVNITWVPFTALFVMRDLQQFSVWKGVHDEKKKKRG